MKASKVATIYARNEGGKILARAKVNNLSASHVESVKRSLLEQIGTMVLRRQIEPREVDIDDSEVVAARNKEAASASKFSNDDEYPPSFQNEMFARAHELVAANVGRSDLSRQFEQKRLIAPAVAPAPVEATEAPAPNRWGGLLRSARRIFRGSKGDR